MKIGKHGGALIGAILAVIILSAFGCESKPREYGFLKVKIIKVVPDEHWFSSNYTTLYEYESGYRDTTQAIMGNEGETVMVRLWVEGYEFRQATNLNYRVK